MVGDMYGHIQDPYDGTQWIESPQTAVYDKDSGHYYQERWILDQMVDKDTWNKTPKILNPDGSLKKTETTTVSGFVGSIQSQKTMISSLVVIGLLGVITYGIMKRK